ncbi:MAG: 1-deoxy-D-xylulose-5-phosphate synthase [Clostridia bacterium]|nr:1-deoxy-D-xylulose-5-phosphate synthase [Clostridia bacterium]
MFLKEIKSPDDLKKIPKNELPQLCDEIRSELISTVSNTGGHLASNLGVVELTVALHSVFNSPEDSVIFDVGHQSYVHKMLTGRYDQFATLRKADGLSGFMNPNESIYDPFISGHSSTSLSSGFGIAKANSMLDKEGRVICVIGDGALTGGLAYEALNNIGRSNENMIIILNDNKMSISKNVGAMAKYLSDVRTRSSYINTKRSVKIKLNKVPLIGRPLSRLIEKTKQALKNVILKQNMFEALGFYYLGPVDGHDIYKMVDVFKSAKEISNMPIVVHAVTTKGKGYDFAESSPESYHGVSSFNYEEGVQSISYGYSEAFGDAICELAEKNNKICAITAAMTDGTGLSKFAEMYPDRFFDVGIAEQHAVTFAAGLASKGMVPIFAVYSSFLQRAFDQIIHDCSIIKQHVVFCIDRAGIVGRDGATHNGLFDAAFLSEIPGVSIFAPSNYSELKEMLNVAINERDGVCAIRYPRLVEPKNAENHYNGNHYYIKNVTSSKIIVTYGNLFNLADKTDYAVCKLNELKIDDKLISELNKFDEIYFFEEGIETGGIGQILASKMLKAGYKGKYNLTAINEFVSHNEIDALLKKYMLDTDSMNRIVSEE